MVDIDFSAPESAFPMQKPLSKGYEEYGPDADVALELRRL